MGIVQVDINVGSPIMGKFKAWLVDGSGVPPANVVRVSDDFSIKCEWYIQGGLATALCGKWYVQAAFEALGQGVEFRSNEEMVVLDGRTPPSVYSTSLDFPAGPNFPTGQPKIRQGDRNAVYEVAVLLSYTDEKGRPGPIAASVNLERLTLYP